MTWPTVAVTTTNTDAGTDVPATARSDILDLMQKVNQIIAHPSALMQGLLASSGVLRNFIDGCTMSTAGSSSTMSIAAGVAMNSANAVLMSLSAISKTTGAWAVGSAAGGLDTGTIANATWYHFYVIRRPDTGVVDVIFSTNASLPTLPTNYTEYRRIGSAITDGSAQWVRFVQRGNEFTWYDQDSSTAGGYGPSIGTSAVLRTVRVPLGVRVRARLVVGLEVQSASGGISAVTAYISSPDCGDVAVPTESLGAARIIGQLAANVSPSSGTVSHRQSTETEVWTDTSSQVRSRLSETSTGIRLYLATIGYMDPRGVDA